MASYSSSAFSTSAFSTSAYDFDVVVTAQIDQPSLGGSKKKRRERLFDANAERLLHEKERQGLVPEGVFDPAREGQIDAPYSQVIDGSVAAYREEINALGAEIDGIGTLMADVKNASRVQSLRIHQVTLQHRMKQLREEQEVLEMYLQLEDDL